MKANLSKCHLLVNKNDEVTIRIGDTEIKNSEYEKLLGIKVDTKQNFNEHLNDMISKAWSKVKALSRVMSYMSLSKKKKLVNSFFNYNVITALLFGYSIVEINTTLFAYIRGACVYYTGTNCHLLKTVGAR